MKKTFKRNSVNTNEYIDIYSFLKHFCHDSDFKKKNFLPEVCIAMYRDGLRVRTECRMKYY